MENGKIKLSELLATALEFKQNPKEDNKNILDNMVHSLVIKPYMSFGDKKIIMAVIIEEALRYSDEADLIQYAATLESHKIVFGLLGHISNIENDVVDTSAIDLCCDVLYETGVVDYILQYCKDDYDKICKMIDDSLNFSNIERIASLAENFSNENLEKFIQTINDMKRELTPERLKDLKTFLMADSPEWQGFKDSVGYQAVEEVLNAPVEQKIDKIKKS